MKEFKYLPIDQNIFRIRYTFMIEETEYEFEFSHNIEGDFITVLIRDQDGKDLFASKLLYGVPLNHMIVDGFNSSILLTPFDLDDLYKDEFENIPVNLETFGSRVRLYLGEKQ
ncbi:hypothetical protein AMR47_16895 [Leptospira interrogans]|nr:hypothetical protein AMR47_16895 [Leptospira interrogans]